MTITIIGLLSAIVLGTIQINRDRGANASIKQNLNSLRSEVELLYSNSLSTYVGVCDTTKVLQIRSAINQISGGTTVCYSGSVTWAASSPLKTPEGSYNYWCVDTRGTARGHASALPLNATVCP